MVFESSLAWILAVLQAYGPLSVFVGIIIEEIIIPIPSPIVPMAAGALLVPAALPPLEAALHVLYVIVIPGSFAIVLGSFFAYAIGYFGGKEALAKLSFLKVSWKDIENVHNRLEKKNTWVSIAVLRALPIFPTSPVSFAAGVLRLSWKKYALATWIGSFPRLFFYGFVGWYFGSSYISFAEQLDIFENIGLGVLAALAIVLVYYYLKKFRDKRLKP